MEVKLNKTLKLFLFILWVFGYLLLISCSSSNTTNRSNSPAISTTGLPDIVVEPLPVYLGFTLPEPGRKYAVKMYEMEVKKVDLTEPGICMSFSPDPMMEAGDFLSQQELLARLSLEVNGHLIDEIYSVLATDLPPQPGPIDPESGEPIFVVPGGSPYQICFAANLKAGLQKVTFIARKTSGDELRYTWSFYLVDFPDTEVELQNLPLYLRDAYPGPGAVVEMSEFKEQGVFHSLSRPKPSVCVQVHSYRVFVELVELNDELFAPETILAGSSLEIDGTKVSEVYSNNRWNGSTTNHDICFVADLDPGLHTATYVFRAPSGEELRYSWPFLLIE